MGTDRVAGGPLLRMYREGFSAGQQAERRRWLAAEQVLLLRRVIELLAGAMEEAGET